ncbi:MAG: shikimate dehydrogenase [Candidatus Zixiibacteriota bacterium]|nr:MAG: shikimate dehydrogenase [candidate division Zixibacteria bacterium]
MSGAGLHFALIGENIAYSKSPAIFETIFDMSAQDGTYEILSISRGRLGPRLKQLVLDGYRGFSVTIPHKQAVIAHLDDIDSTARAVEAVNCVAVVDGQLLGYNTDVFGLSLSLRRFAERLKGRDVIILGNGGAARAAVYALRRHFDTREVTICGRSNEQLENCCQALKTHLPDLPLNTRLFSELTDDDWRDGMVIVNATPLGGPNHVNESPLPKQFRWPRDGIYIDLNYNADNRSLQQAKASGLIAVDGSGMLVGQALKAYEIWTGESVPFEPVYNAVFGNQSGMQAISHG